MTKFSFPHSFLITIFLIVVIVISVGCARKGGFSKEGAYEILQGIGDSQNTTMHDEPKEKIDYYEYERNRKELLKNKN